MMKTIEELADDHMNAVIERDIWLGRRAYGQEIVADADKALVHAYKAVDEAELALRTASGEPS